MAKRPPLKEIVKLFGGVIAKSGTTTLAGAGTGDSIIDASLVGAGANSFVNMLVILYPGDSARVDSARCTIFNNGNGEVTFEHAYKGVAAALPAGIPYAILTLPFATAVAVAALLAALNVPVADVGTNVLERDVIGNKTDAAVLVVSAANSIVAYVKGILQRVNLILSQVIAIFTLKETGGTITTDGNVQDVYRVETPAGIFKPATLFIDFTNSTAAETIEIKLYYRIVPIPGAGTWRLFDTQVFAGVVADPKLKAISLLENRFGILVTLQATAGGPKDYPWEVFFSD